MVITADNDPLEDYGYDVTLTVAEVMDLLDVSDGCARKFLKQNDLYLKVGGNVRVPRLGLARVLFGGEEEDEDGDVIDFPSMIREAQEI